MMKNKIILFLGIVIVFAIVAITIYTTNNSQLFQGALTSENLDLTSKITSETLEKTTSEEPITTKSLPIEDKPLTTEDILIELDPLETRIKLLEQEMAKMVEYRSNSAYVINILAMQVCNLSQIIQSEVDSCYFSIREKIDEYLPNYEEESETQTETGTTLKEPVSTIIDLSPEPVARETSDDSLTKEELLVEIDPLDIKITELEQEMAKMVEYRANSAYVINILAMQVCNLSQITQSEVDSCYFSIREKIDAYL